VGGCRIDGWDCVGGETFRRKASFLLECQGRMWRIRRLRRACALVNAIFRTRREQMECVLALVGKGPPDDLLWRRSGPPPPTPTPPLPDNGLSSAPHSGPAPRPAVRTRSLSGPRRTRTTNEDTRSNGGKGRGGIRKPSQRGYLEGGKRHTRSHRAAPHASRTRLTCHGDCEALSLFLPPSFALEEMETDANDKASPLWPRSRKGALRAGQPRCRGRQKGRVNRQKKGRLRLGPACVVHVLLSSSLLRRGIEQSILNNISVRR